MVPARIIHRSEDLGTLKLNEQVGDAVLFDLEEGSFPLYDSYGDVRTASLRLSPSVVVKNGAIYLG